MSEPLRIALIAEGPTDRVVINSILSAVIPERNHILIPIQPEDSVAFGSFGPGWPGVYKWCRQTAREGGGRLSANGLLENFDLIVLHLDADVADVPYQSANIQPEPSDSPLPCAQPCPPPEATTDALRRVLLSWCGETAFPPKMVVCIPSKSTETWVVAALFPDDAEVRRDHPFECFANPAERLAQQPARSRIRKSSADYRARMAAIAAAWPRLAGPGGLTAAARFDADLRAALERA